MSRYGESANVSVMDSYRESEIQPNIEMIRFIYEGYVSYDNGDPVKNHSIITKPEQPLTIVKGPVLMIEMDRAQVSA